MGKKGKLGIYVLNQISKSLYLLLPGQLSELKVMEISLGRFQGYK